jgi:hypothetical protein
MPRGENQRLSFAHLALEDQEKRPACQLSVSEAERFVNIRYQA